MSDKKQFKSQYKKKTETTKHTGTPSGYRGPSLPDFEEEDDEEEEEEEEEEPVDYLDMPDRFFFFPDELPFGDKEFRHILFEGAHCLL